MTDWQKEIETVHSVQSSLMIGTWHTAVSD